MTKEDIMHLGTLSRIALTDTEAVQLQAEIEAIVDYVSTVTDIVGTDEVSPQVGARYNILRPDETSTEAGEYTEALLDAAPRRQGQYLVVNKIIQQD